MKSKLLTSIRWKIIVLFLLSIVLAVMIDFLLLGTAYVLHESHIFSGLFSTVSNTVGVVPIMVLTGILLFVLVFFLLTQRSVKYLGEISNTLQEIENGRLDVKIPVRSSDELGELAESINRMAVRLKASIEDERNAERAKNELITSVSHDLRTPLTSILGYLGLIVNDRYKDEIELRYYIDIAYQKSGRLKKLIDELFEFTRISYGGIRFKPVRINLGELLEQLTEEFFPIFQDAGMKYRLSLPAERIYVTADGDILARVFENLIANAVCYGREGRYMDIELSNENNSAVVRVSNYGSPIPAQDLPHIFDKFYRVERSRSEETGGTGLGLAIAKSIVEMHGGTISVRSAIEKTTFEVRLHI